MTRRLPTPYYEDSLVSLHHGDCREVMAAMPDASVDAIVCDPPYELGFMGKAWDSAGVAFDLETWRQALRVLKPGGHLLAFGGTRTVHRMVCAIEDAGFEIRDQIDWLYGSGFPKSLDVSKAIDKAAGAEREVIGVLPNPATPRTGTFNASFEEGVITKPATPAAEQWDGWGTSLKPAHEPVVCARKPTTAAESRLGNAHEPICVARKPFAGTVAQNVLAHGTGAINVDGCRVSADARPLRISHGEDTEGKNTYGSNGPGGGSHAAGETSLGRWPANVILSHGPDCELVGTRTIRGDQRDTGNGTRQGGFVDVGADSGDPEPNAAVYGDEVVDVYACAEGCPVAEIDRQSGEGEGFSQSGSLALYGDAGGASRFFYCAKANTDERNWGLGSRFAPTFAPTMGNGIGGKEHDPLTATPKRNVHPTVKPIALMRWLCRLVTPPDGVVLDPFLGSGTTGIAALGEGFRFIGIEADTEHGYIEMAKARILATQGVSEGSLFEVAP